MNDIDAFVIRTEDIRPDQVLDLFVSTERDLEIVNQLKSKNPVIIEGSRGTGKSFLLRVCEQQQLKEFSKSRVLPIYISFIKSSLISSANVQQFQLWMIAKLAAGLLRTLNRTGLLTKTAEAINLLSGDDSIIRSAPTKLEAIAQEFEESYKSPGVTVNSASIPMVEDFRNAVQDICDLLDISRFNVLFDEAAHIFRPEQQRQFFTLFRDLRSPYMTCNAAVYPGVTSYGTTFESTHDAQILSLNRDINSSDYRKHMRDIVMKQASSKLQVNIEKNGKNFDALAYSVNGNPRLLLKTVALAGKLSTTEVESVLKDFYRTQIWSEHSALPERYPGHRGLVDWGRKFLEAEVIDSTRRKNDTYRKEGKSERTCYFWVQKDAPTAVKEALRLLCYTGIITQIDKGIVATRAEIGNRYSISIGCLAAPDPHPINYISEICKSLSIKRFTEYGKNYPAFVELTEQVGDMIEPDLSEALLKLLSTSIDRLELSGHQKRAMRSIGITTLELALSSSENTFQQADYIGPVRSRKIMNVAQAAVLEFLSG